MKKIAQKTGSLLLALALTASPAALAAETAGSGIYTATGIQYAYSEAGVIHLYDETGKTIVATLGNGAKLTVTDGQKDGLTYVHFGSAAGWIKDEELYQQLPQNVTGEVSGSSAPANQLIPVQTTPPQQSGGDSTSGDELKPAVGQGEETGAAGESGPAGENGVSEENGAVEENTGETDNPPIEGETEETPDEESSEASGTDPDAAADAKKDHDPIPAMYEPEETGASPEAVDVVQLGAAMSVIILDGERQLVDTRLLTFGEEVHADQRIGYVHAPRTGQAGLRAEPSKEGKVITQLKAGQLAAVLSIDEDYAHVNVQGQEGWLRLDCLKYLTVTDAGIVSSALQEKKAGESKAEEEDSQAETEEADDSVVITDDNGDPIGEEILFPASALLSLKGETDGSDSVNLRNLPTRDASKTAVLRTGVTVTVLSRTEGWYLVEADGVCGFVMEAFLTMED